MANVINKTAALSGGISERNTPTGLTLFIASCRCTGVAVSRQKNASSILQ
ncbi:hypothetical protein QNH14_02785 [Apirhabdus apintestini]|nr:hypothetical protein QNH14_02785 [Enterobacteriaceae bacterium CA-0114]